MTHEKVAEIAGVSLATVSRVVNNRSGVSRKRAKLVRQVMSDLNYDPVPLDQRPSRNLQTVTSTPGKTGNIGVLILDHLYQFAPNLFASQMRGVERGAVEHGLNAIVSHAATLEQISPAIAQGQVDGLILIGSVPPPWLRERLANVPRVWLNSHQEAVGDSVLAGNHQIGGLAADYLLNRGHRELAYLCAMVDHPPYPTRSSAFRFRIQEREESAGVQQFVSQAREENQRAGISHQEEVRRLHEQIVLLVDQLLSASPRVTGLFVPNDFMTAIVYAVLAERGLKPDRDLEIISCNNEMSCLTGLYPRPATIDVGAEAIGVRGIEQLVWRMRHPDDDRLSALAVTPLLIDSSGVSI